MKKCPLKLRKETIQRQGNRCYLCGLDTFMVGVFHIHRMVPNREGGTYTRGNIAALCKECHIRCEGFTWEEILTWNPYGEFLSLGK